MGKIRIGIVGYGNIGRGVEQSIKRNDDMELKAVFTRRDPASVKIQTEGAEVKHFDDMEAMKDDIDVMILCGGSATDLPVIGPKVAASFNTIDSFDTHAKIPEYFANVDKAAKEGKNVSIISVGWDPGMFSLNRLYAESILVQGSTYTFWGKGVSQGHSDAIRRIEGVKNGIQYTVPIEAAVDQVRSGSEPELTTRQKHLRECYVVAEEGADKDGKNKEFGGGGIAFNQDGSERSLTQEEIMEELNAPDIEYEKDGSVILYYKNQSIDITHKFNKDNICYVKLVDGDDSLYVTVKYNNGYASSPNKYISPWEFN